MRNTTSHDHTSISAHLATKGSGVHVDVSAAGMYLRFMGVSNVMLQCLMMSWHGWRMARTAEWQQL